jgi:hypothetical protein
MTLSARFYPMDAILPTDGFLPHLRAIKLHPHGRKKFYFILNLINFFPSAQTQKKIIFLFLFYFYFYLKKNFPSVRTLVASVPAGPASTRPHAHVRADTTISPRGNFKTDATVRLSHGQPNSHCPHLRPST